MPLDANALGARIKQIRGSISQLKLAKELDVSQTAIGNYENGTQVPGGGFILTFCEKFGLEPRWLLTGEGAMYSNVNFSDHNNIDANIFMDKNAARIAALEKDLSLAQERLKMTQEFHKEAKERIDDLKQELRIARLERDRANQESIKTAYLALKAAYPDLEIPAQAQGVLRPENFTAPDSATAAPLIDRSND